MTTGNVQSIEKTQKALESSSPSRAIVRQSSGGISLVGLDVAFAPQMAGNLAVQRLLSSGAIQAKLSVSQPSDPYELEADRVARHVVSMSDSMALAALQPAPPAKGDAGHQHSLQSKPLPLAASITPFVQRTPHEANDREEDKEQDKADEVVQAKRGSDPVFVPLQRQETSEKNENETVQAKRIAGTRTESLQRQAAAQEEERDSIQVKSAASLGGSLDAGSEVEARLSQSKGGGNPLPDPVRTYMEPRFGVDFSHVRVHTNSSAIQMNRNIAAQAFTHGSDIYYGAGSTPSNLELTAHELTHVVQQASGAPLRSKRLEGSPTVNIDPSIQRTCATYSADKEEEKRSDPVLQRHSPVSGAPAAGGIMLSDPTDPHERAAEGSAGSNRHQLGSPLHMAHEPSAVASAAATPTVQRQTPTADPAPAPPTNTGQAGAWNAPEDFGAVADRGSARIVLGEMLKEIDGFKDVEIGEVPQQRLVTYKAIERHKGMLQGEGLLTAAEASELNSLTFWYTKFMVSARTSLMNALLAGLRGLCNPPGMDEVLASIADAKHALFKKPNDDKLEKIKDAAEKVNGISENANWVAKNALKIMTDVEQARKVFEISEKLEKFGGVIEKVLTVKKLGDDLVKLASEAGGGNSILGGGDALEAGVDLAGVIGKSAMKAVPLFGDYWNKYLVPMTKKCCAMLRKMENIVDEINLSEIGRLIENPSATPPELRPEAYLTLEGGRAVFEYLYLTRFGKQPAMSSYVEKVIMQHRDVLEKSSGADVELEEAHWYNPLSWVKRKAKDLPAWVASHISEVWASFYGSAGGGYRK